jgi:chorismate--pyruvate lyase
LRVSFEASQAGWLYHPLLLPRPLRGWLTDQGSLTRRLKRHCPAFRVHPTRIGRFRTSHDENRALRLGPGCLAYVREVILDCGNLPVVFAHSVVALDSLRGPWAAVTRLGSRPLGEALFSNPRISRGHLQYKRLSRRHPLARQAIRSGIAAANLPLWARRSFFFLQGRPILVTEVFLQDIRRIEIKHG